MNMTKTKQKPQTPVRSTRLLGELYRRKNRAWSKFVDTIGTPDESKAWAAFSEARRKYETTKFA